MKHATQSAIIDGRFGTYCNIHIKQESRGASASKASYDRERDREAHEKDLLQPFLPNGKPNTEFIRAYPDSENFTKEQLEEYG